ncbi:MAG: hypothetical protein JST14_06165 [Bacteroidetes bacterium]|nr:hypothetical protein [Bacteroidota bacterium]
MKTKMNRLFLATAFLLVTAGAALAQGLQPAIQYFRPYDKNGLNVFETSKADTTPYTGFKVRFGAGFTQGYQSMSHSNSARANLGGGIMETAPGTGIFVNGAGVTQPIVADPNVYGGYKNTVTNTLYTNSNQLYQMAGGFPLAQANFNIDVQLTDGVRVSLVSYMSSHHHNEFWVKGGYFQIDKVGFLGSEFMNNLWKNLTLKVGHMEVNYGDQHFRRSDGGNTLLNPFIENNIMDEFTTEIGGELYWQKNGILLMVGMTDGEIQGNVTRPNDRSPNLYTKIGYDKQLNEKLRVRLTGSMMQTKSSVSNTLFGGDRTGSNYQYVLQPYNATLTGNAFAGRFNPGFSDNLTTFMVNPFVKYGGFEFFGTWETAHGNTSMENGEIQYSNNTTTTFSKLDDRYAHQVAAELVYRFGGQKQFWVGAKYNEVNATIVTGASSAQNTTGTAGLSQGTRLPVSVYRDAYCFGWYLTKNIGFKGEYVNQHYFGYPTDNILSGGKFNGFVIQGSISF